ncbi:MAG: ABC transporter substrate-binding protein [Thermoleophilia bacterium]
MAGSDKDFLKRSFAADPLSRRQFLKWAGVTGTAVGLGGVLAGCADDGATTTTAAGGTATTAGETSTTAAGTTEGREIKIGYVSPQTGPLAGFGEADQFIIDGALTAFGAGLTIGGALHPIKILAKDSQSDPNRAAEVAGDLILSDGVDLMLVASTPETTNPVSDQAEANGVPCISTVAPWQPYFFGRNGDPAVGFNWTYHFFWGLEDIIAVFQDMWSQVENNKVVGGMWPNDGDGNAWGDAELGFPPALTAAGYTIVDPGRYQNLTDDFSAQISQFKNAGVEIVTGVPIPPDFTTFWKQAAQQGFKPKIASIGKALLFPSSVEALGELGDGMSTEVWWSPSHPFSSSLTGESSQELADGYTASTGKQWTQPIGFAHALFELAADALKRTADVDDKAAIAEAVKTTKLDTIVGPVDFSSGPVPNVAKTPLVGGQWGPGTDFKYEMVVVSNSLASNIPTAGSLRPIP